jgi:hypothetical protein
MKSTTLLINGRKTNFTFKRLLKSWENNEFTIKAEQRRYVMTSFGEARLEYLSCEKIFKLSYINYNDFKYIEA